MLNKQVYDVLVDLGLSPLQAKIYCALVQLNDPTAHATSKLAKVARQEVYRIAEELETIGMVSRTVSKPTRFQPVQVADALSSLIEQKIKSTSVLAKKIKEINIESVKKQEKILLSYVIKELPSDGQLFGKTPLKFKTATTFDLLTSFERLSSRINTDQKVFRKAAKNRKTMIRIIVDKPPADSPLIKLIEQLKVYPYFKMRFIDTKSEADVVIFNKKEAALSLDPNKHVGPPYLFSNHPSFLFLANEYFDLMWTNAIEW